QLTFSKFFLTNIFSMKKFLLTLGGTHPESRLVIIDSCGQDSINPVRKDKTIRQKQRGLFKLFKKY
ncbi:MAG: hypothetical protein K2F94_10830, partial [Muribaculaceae bacterium]|nr:hypothetical protein [Muribaculaceae bacterium]